MVATARQLSAKTMERIERGVRVYLGGDEVTVDGERYRVLGVADTTDDLTACNPWELLEPYSEAEGAWTAAKSLEQKGGDR